MRTFKKLSKTLLIATALTTVSIAASEIPDVATFTGIEAQAQEHPLASPERAAAALAAKQSRPRLKSTTGMGERAAKILGKVQEFMQAEPPQYAEAMAMLKKQKLDRLNSTERVSFLQLMSSNAQSLDNMDEAMGYYKQILAMDSISYTLRDQITFFLGQIEFSNNNYAVARQYFEEWFKYQPTPSISNIVIFANVYYASGLEDNIAPADAERNFRKSVEFLNWAVSKSKADGKPDKENWYSVLRALHNNLGEFDKVLDYAELLASRWPKKEYWIQLSGLYAQKSAEEGLSEAESEKFEKKQLAAFELLSRQDMLENGREFESMAQLYLYHEAPFNSSKILESSFEKDLSEQSQKNFNLLAMAYINGKDLEKAVIPLAKAAELSDDGNLYIQLANVYLNLDQYTDATDAIDKGLAKGGVRRPDQSRLLQGQAYLSLENFDEARKSFRDAGKDDRSKKSAQQLLRYVDNEEKRIKAIREYLS